MTKQNNAGKCDSLIVIMFKIANRRARRAFRPE